MNKARAEKTGVLYRELAWSKGACLHSSSLLCAAGLNSAGGRFL